MRLVSSSRQPTSAAITCQFGGLPHQPRRDSLPLPVRKHGRIEQERMRTAVPGDIDVTHKSIGVERPQMKQASGQYLFAIGGIWPVAPGSREQSIETCLRR